VLVSETACPFCTGSLADAFADLAPRLAPRVRLGRAATLAFGALAMTQGACYEKGSSPPDATALPVPVDAGVIPVDADLDGGTPIYAAAPTPDGGTPTRG
jgi:hypothetical protein